MYFENRDRLCPTKKSKFWIPNLQTQFLRVDYLEDIINQLIEEAEEALELKENPQDKFEKDKLFGYYEIISKLLNQAEDFRISDKIPSKWRDFNPEELLSEMS